MLSRIALAFQRISNLFGLRPGKRHKKKLSRRSLPPREPGGRRSKRKSK